MTRGEPPKKLLWLIHVADFFLSLNKLRQVESVWKIKTGLERGQLLPRKLRNTVQMQQLSTCHSNFQFSQQLLTAFKSCSVFSDPLNLLKLMQRPKIFLSTNRQRRFSRQLSSCHGAASGQCFSVFSATTGSILDLIQLSRQKGHL
jgi:hypothetical protein